MGEMKATDCNGTRLSYLEYMRKCSIIIAHCTEFDMKLFFVTKLQVFALKLAKLSVFFNLLLQFF